MERRTFVRGLLGFGALTGADLLAACGPSGKSTASGGTKILKVIRTTDLSSLDPVWTTAGATKDYAYLTFDQLVALDANYQPQPQMAQGWTLEDDGRTFLFKLRDGLKWHDGTPVRAQDCVASIDRWSKRDSFGQVMASALDSMPVVDDTSFRVKFTKPFALLPNALGKTAGPQCFIMPERMAKTAPSTQITECIGSGPFKFLKDEWVAGSHAAWAKFDGYVPRKEAPSGTAGGKTALVDRIEWAVIRDPSTAAAALKAGENDYWEFFPADLAPLLKADPHIHVEERNKSGGYEMVQFNHLQPPFDNPAIRRAFAMAVDQREYLAAAQADPSLHRPQYGIYTLGTEYATEEGADILKVASIDKAKAALSAAGYKGEKVVLLASGDVSAVAAMNEVCRDMMAKLGMNVEMVAMDSATMFARRMNKGPVDKGGWSLFLTGWTGNDVLNPCVNPMLRGSGEKGFPGWCTDPELERLRMAWAFAVDPAERKRLATAVQVQALKTLPYVPIGNLATQSAWRDTVTGVYPAPVSTYWDIGKA